MPRVRSTMVEGLRQAYGLARLPPSVAWFYVRAVVTALRSDERWSLRAASRPSELATLLRHARGRRRVVELGTGTGWAAIAFALSDGAREVITFDPVVRPGRERYFALVPENVRARIDVRNGPAEAGVTGGMTADFVFVDSQHSRDATLEAFAVWEPVVAPGGVIAFHDYGNLRWPGVAEAVAALGLSGRVEPLLFVWQKPQVGRSTDIISEWRANETGGGSGSGSSS